MDSSASLLEDLPPIPGEWGSESIVIGGRTFDLILPRQPEAFLDDPEVIAANQKDDYMPYWATLWPGARTMAGLLARAPWPAGTQLLELGAGVGLVGLVAQSMGHPVVYSDYDPMAVQVCRRNALRNGLPDPEVLVLDWRTPPDRRFAAIIGCEVTYDPKLHEALLNTVEAMLLPGGVCWLGDPGRYWSRQFHEQSSQRFQVRVFNDQLRECSFPSDREFQIFELRDKVLSLTLS